MTPATKCFYCDEPATKLCDFQIGGPIGGYVRDPKHRDLFYPVFAIEKLPYTCDMPICDRHAHHRGNIFFSAGKDSGMETIDYCEEHRFGQSSGQVKPVLPEEADAARREILFQARRRLIRDANRTPAETPPG